MPVTTVPQTDFSGGEWAPSLYARTELAKYRTAVKQLTNCIPHAHGPVSNRSGMKFIAEVKDSSTTARLMPFQFSVTQSYILEFGNLYMRVYKDSGQVLRTGASAANVDVVEAATYKWTASGSGTSEYYLELLAGGDPGLTEPFNILENATETTKASAGSLTAGQWGYGDNDTLGYSTIYVRMTDSTDPDSKADGYVVARFIVEVVTTYVTADLRDIKFAQSADVLYLVHPSYPPRKITRSAHDAWTIGDIAFGPNVDPPTSVATTGGAGALDYVVTSVSADGEESGPSTAITSKVIGKLTWTAPAAGDTPDYYNVYKSDTQSGFYGYIGFSKDGTTGFTETVAITPNYLQTPPVDYDPFTSTDNYPGAIAFYEQRLYLGRTNNAPQSFWGTVIGSYENLNKSTPLRDDDSVKFTMNAMQVNAIQWMIPLNFIVMGTAGGEWKVASGSEGSTITPTSIDIKRQSQWGVSSIAPIVIGDTVLFLEGANNVVRDLRYDLQVDGYAGNDVTIFANHLFANATVVAWAYQQHPNSIIWCVKSDGTMVGLTYSREQNVWGWHKHTTDGDFEDIANIRNDNSLDDAYMIVKRVINGVTKRYVEKFQERLPYNSNFELDIKDAYFVDSGISYDSPKTITGFAYTQGTYVITAALHGFSNEELVDIKDVLVTLSGEVASWTGNDDRYVVANKAANTFELENTTQQTIRSTAYKWTASGSGTSEYYLELLAGGDPGLLASGYEPTNIYENSTAMTEATAGSLTAGQWDYGDNDTLGYNTIYVRMTDSVDPDTKPQHFLKRGVGIAEATGEVYSSGGEAREAVTNLSGLTHLEGKTVAVLADGNVVEGLTVSSGAITIPSAASKVLVGLGYTSVIKTLEYNLNTEKGSIQDQARNIPSVTLRLENTRGLKIGPQADRLTDLLLREDENFDVATNMFTGDKDIVIERGEVKESSLYIENVDPVPFSILGLFVKIKTADPVGE